MVGARRQAQVCDHAAAVERGATGAGSAAEAARASELVITMLPSSPHVEAVYLGAGGVLEGAGRGRLCIDMSTIDPAVSRRVAAALGAGGVRFVDAPVSGGVAGAQNGTLTFMVGGTPEEFEQVKPLLKAMGKNLVHCGGSCKSQERERERERGARERSERERERC